VPAFTDRFRVIAYARRGHGRSDPKGPFDNATLTEDLRGLMDGLRIPKAHLVGHSMGGMEITGMAGTHPERVGRIVYLDGAYDWNSPVWAEGVKSAPSVYMTPSVSAMRSIDAFRTHLGSLWFPGVSDSRRYEAYMRDQMEIQSDGSVRFRMSESLGQSVFTTLFNERPDYAKVHSPALAIYAMSMFEVRNGDAAQLAENRAWEEKYMIPFRQLSVDRLRRELPNVEFLNAPGNHNEFIFTSRASVVADMRRFLHGAHPRPPPAA
jgi:pimeloyl-ACP methyl ester carboxylesterase